MRIMLAAAIITVVMVTGSTVARQAFAWHNRPIIGWCCPHCGARNASDPEATLEAHCRVCHDGFVWQRVLPEHYQDPTFLAALKGRNLPDDGRAMNNAEQTAGGSDRLTTEPAARMLKTNDVGPGRANIAKEKRSSAIKR